jgi:hypothetical protein
MGVRIWKNLSREVSISKTQPATVQLGTFVLEENSNKASESGLQ